MSTSEPRPPNRLRLPVIRWLRRWRVAVIAVVAIALVLISSAHWFRTLPAPERWETQVYDIRFRSRGAHPGNPHIAIAGITEGSLNADKLKQDAAASPTVALMQQNTWPWPRTIHAQVIERLFECGARMVAVDVVFAAERAEDDALAAVLSKYKDRIVLASIVQDSEGGLTFFQPNARLQQALSPDAVGFASYSKDQLDGVVRHFNFRTSELREFGMDDDSQNLLNFAALGAAKFSGGSVGHGYLQLLNYQGPEKTYQHVPVNEIFVKKLFEQGSRYDGGRVFKDKLVFYGPIAEVLHDVHNTPFGIMPGVEIHAQLAASLLNHQSLSWASDALWRTLAAILALATVAAVIFIRNPALQVVSVLVLAAGYWFATQFAFSHSGLVFPVIPPLFAMAATGAFGVVFLFFLEQWEKAHTRKVLNRMVSKRIAAVILKNAEEFEQGRMGERKPVAILFTDIRSFTSWTETAQPEHLVGQMNEYFARMVPLIEDENEGNAQKFIGDAILSAWGDTHTIGPAEDARRAVATALSMRKALRELNTSWDNRTDRKVISIGMGVNYGDVVAGEVGPPERGEFTVLGDGVNFAARLESATKQFHTDCLVGEGVEALTRDKFIFRHVDYLKVKGKTKPVNVYTLVSDSSVPPPAWLEEYNRARALYVARDFAAAADLFRKVKERNGGEDFLCDMYAERCALYAKEPPPPDWDGSFTLTEK